MRILEIIFTLQSGGAERFVVDLSNELSKSNDITLLTLKDDQIDKENRNFYKFDLSKRVKYRNLGLKDGSHLISLWKVYKAVKEINPDIVHLHLKDITKFCILPLFLLNNKIKFYQTIHSDLQNGYNLGYNKFIFETLGKKQKIKIIAISKKNYNDFVSYYPYVNIRYIVNGRSPIVKTEKFDNVNKEIKYLKETPNTRIFLHIARFHEVKNQKLLIDAFNILYEQKVDAKLLIIGSGYDTKEGQDLLSKCSPNIHYLGTKKNISDYMLCADVFCLSSKFEGMPITLLEASLAGVPCISTPVCGSIDLIKDGENGYISKDFSLKEYLNTIQLCLEHYNTLKSNAMILSKNNPYTIEECARKYIKYFN